MISLDQVKKSIKNKFIDPDFIIRMARGVYELKTKNLKWENAPDKVKQEYLANAVWHIESMFGNRNEYRLLLSFYLNDKAQKNMSILDIIIKAIYAHLTTFQDDNSDKNKIIRDHIKGTIPGKMINGVQDFEYDQDVDVQIGWHLIKPNAALEWEKELANRIKE